MHERFTGLLGGFNLNPEFLASFEGMIRERMQTYSEQARQERAVIKKRLTETETAMQKLKVRWALKEVSEDVYQAGMQELQSRKDTYTLEMERWSEKLSNCIQMIPVVVATASNISSLWKYGSLEIKRKIQKLVFPEGLYWDNAIADYRTPKTCKFFDIIGGISGIYENKKGTAPDKTVPLCG